ncbi:hypothetical protein Tco_0177955 [Tanacetum coccineum]
MSKEVGTPRYLSLVVSLKKVGDEAVHKELGDRIERVATTASSLEAEQEQDSGSGPRCQDTILGDVNAQTRFEITSKQSNDPPLSRGYTLGSGDDSMKQLQLMELCTQLSYKNRKSVLFLLLVYLNAAKLMLMLLGSVNAVRHMLMLPVQVPAAEVNPIIYTSYIDQFWATAKVQTVNGVLQLQALVNKKRLIIMESSIRRDLYLDDAEGTDCLPTVTIFEELTRMGASSTAWNEFICSMASLIICLATNQKFNLSKYIFDAMVKHLDGWIKFLMYPRFLKVFINQKLGDMSTHKKIFVNLFHTKKVFANMKRPGKDFSGRITPLFDTMMVQPSEELGENSDHPTDSTQVPILDKPSTSSKPKKKQQSKKTQRQEAEVSQDETKHEDCVRTPSMIHNMWQEVGYYRRVESFEDQDEFGVSEVDPKQKGRDITLLMLIVEVLLFTIEEITLAQTLIQIKAAKPKVFTTAATTTTITRPKDKGVVVQEPSEFRVPQEAQPSISKDKGKGIMIELEVPLKRKDQIALDEQIARDIQAKLDAELIEEQKLARKQEEGS